MRDYGKVSPQFWIDYSGNEWKVPTIKGRLKPGKCPGHAALREYVIERGGRKCMECGKGESEVFCLVADHIVSRKNGGTHHPDNMQCLCNSCNSRKAGLIDSKGPVNGTD